MKFFLLGVIILQMVIIHDMWALVDGANVNVSMAIESMHKLLGVDAKLKQADKDLQKACGLTI